MVSFYASERASFNNMRTLNFKCVFRFRQSSVRRLLPASDYCRARGNQIVEHSADNESVLGRCRKLGGTAEHLIDGSEKHICRLSFEFRVRVLLKDAVTKECQVLSNEPRFTRGVISVGLVIQSPKPNTEVYYIKTTNSSHLVLYEIIQELNATSGLC